MFSRSEQKRRRWAGFTLPEILVALVILTLALCAILPSFSNGLSGLDTSKFYSQALTVARSKIDQLGTEIGLEETELRGMTESGLTWVARLSPRQAVGSRRGIGDEDLSVISYEVEVTVADDNGRRLTIGTLRLAPLQ